MNLQSIVPARRLTYYWNEPKGYPYVPTMPLRPRNSRQGWYRIGDPTHQVPTGAQVAAAGLDTDGTRGIYTFWTPWAPAIGAAWDNIAIAVWKSTEAAPAIFNPATPANALAGRLGLPVAAADSAATVATSIAATILLMLTTQAKLSLFHKLGGGVLPDVVRTDLGNGTVAIVSPRLWRESRFVHSTGAFAAATRQIEHPATVRPILLAYTDQPWQIAGQATPGFGIDRGQVG